MIPTVTVEVTQTAQAPSTVTPSKTPTVNVVTVSEQLPPDQIIARGGSFETTNELAKWSWICRGDFDLVAPIQKRLYDYGTNSRGEDAGRSGLIVILQPDSQITLYAQWGGYCEAQKDSESIETRLPMHINLLLTTSDSCDGSTPCDSVDIVYLSETGEITSSKVCPGDTICR